MAFGSSAVGVGGASRADVVFRANIGQFRSDVNEARQVYQRTTAQMSDAALRMTVAQEKLDRAISKYGAESRQAKQATLAYRSEMRSLEQQTERTDRELVQTQRHLDRLGRGALAGSGAFRGLGRSVAFASTAFLGSAGLVYAIRSAITTGLDFEREMRNVNSIARLSDEEFANLTKSVLSLAGPSAQAPKTLAEGLYDLESSGFSASDSLTVLEASSKAATAGLTDNATATKAVAAALNAYHLPADQARRVSDILFATVDKGVITFAELAQNMGDLVPAAAPLGVRLEEVGAAIATITLQGVPAAEAATRVNRSLLLLAKPSEELTRLLKQQGYESAEAAVKALGYAGVLELIDKRTRGNVAATAKLAPEIRSLLGVVGLTGKNLAVYQKNLQGIEQAQQGAGRTASVFAEQSKSNAFQLQRLSANVNVLEIALSTALNPAIGDVARGVSEWIEEGDNLERLQARINDAVKTGTEAVHGFVTVLGFVNERAKPVIEVLGGMEHAVEALVTAAVLRRLGLLRIGIAGVGTAAATSAAEITAMGTAAGAAGSRVGLLGRVAGGLNALSIGGFVAVTAAQSLHAHLDEPNRITAEQLRDPKTRARIRDAVGAEGLAKLDAIVTSQGLAGRPDEGTRGLVTNRPAAPRPPGRGGGNRRTGDGLTRVQGLTLAVERAQLTKSLQDDLAAGRNLLAYYQGIASNTKLTGDKLYQARQDVLQQQQRVQSIEDQIVADRQQAQEEAARKRAKAAKAREAVRRDTERQVKAAEDALPGNTPYANTSAKFAAGGISPSELVRRARKEAGLPDEVSAADLERLFSSFLSRFVEIQTRFASNIAGGSLSTVVLEQLTRETNGHLASMRAVPRGIRRAEDEAAFA